MANAEVKPTTTGAFYDSLPQAQVEYWPDTQTLTVYTDKECHEGETLSHGFVVFYDADDNVAGFMVDGAETLLKPFVDAILEKKMAEREKEPAAAL